MFNRKGITYEARKSTPRDLGSLKNARECKSVANTAYINKVMLVSEVKQKVKLQMQYNNQISINKKKTDICVSIKFDMNLSEARH